MPAAPPTPPPDAPVAGYADYLVARDQLAAQIAAASALCRAQGADARADALDRAAARLGSDAFRLLVLGEFKRGKSTFINALLGQRVLPARVAPCTGVITVVRFGDPPRARLIPRGAGADPLEVPVDEIARYIEIQDDGFDEGAVAPSPWARVELDFPLPLCRNNVLLVDSPGLNEHTAREEITLSDLPEADAVLMVLSCEQQLSRTERDFITAHLGEGPLAHVFFVWNRFDAVRHDPAEVAALDQLGERWLRPRLSREARVFPLSARDALGARVAGDAAALRASGLPELEAALERFLVVERGAVKLQAPREAARRALDWLLREALPAREALLTAPLAELEARIAAQRPRLDLLQRQRARLVRDLHRRRDALQRELSAVIERFGERLESRVDAAAAEVGAGWLDATFNRARTRARLLDWLRAWLDGETRRLDADELRPLLDREARELMDELEERLGAFLVDLDAVRAGLGLQVGLDVGAPPPPAVPPVERVLGAVGGFFLGGVDGAITGANQGWRALIHGIPVYVSAAVAVALLGVTGPVGVGVLAAVGALRTWMTGKDTVERLRAEVVDAVVQAVRDQLPAARAEVEDRAAERFQALIDAVDAGMAALVDEVEADLRAAAAERAAGEARVAAARVELETAAGAARDLLLALGAA